MVIALIVLVVRGFNSTLARKLMLIC